MNDETELAAIIHAALVDADTTLARCAKESSRERRKKIAEDWHAKHDNLINNLAVEVYETE